jgi:hypothetical protein
MTTEKQVDFVYRFESGETVAVTEGEFAQFVCKEGFAKSVWDDL